MTFTSMDYANSKTAEFARLFDLFDRVATRRTRALAGNTSEVISADDVASVPTEFAPLLKNLSTVLALRTRRDEAHVRPTQAGPAAEPREPPPNARPTTSTAKSLMPHVDAADQAEEDADRPVFPLGAERYPFTFKLMLHKLYDLEEWADKVKSAVETSRSQFKPLADRVQDVVGDATVTASIKERGEGRSIRPCLGASAKFKPPRTARRSLSVAVSREAVVNTKERVERRNGIRPILGTSAKFKPPTMTRHIHTRSATAILVPTKPEARASRVLKKRCIGRRKSISGPVSTGVWVYDAAISATEVAGPHPAVEITLSAPRVAGATIENRRARHRSLTSLGEMESWDAPRRKVKITVPLLPVQEGGGKKIVSPRPSSVVQEVSGTETRSAKRRLVAPAFASEQYKRVAVNLKRPLCV